VASQGGRAAVGHVARRAGHDAGGPAPAGYPALGRLPQGRRGGGGGGGPHLPRDGAGDLQPERGGVRELGGRGSHARGCGPPRDMGAEVSAAAGL
ncbi:MAG: (AF072135) II.1 protein, partial [uncultured Rubellimicrobium sp.]